MGSIKLPVLAGKDAFHRVPNFSDKEWDAVERVLTGRAKAKRCWHQELDAALAVRAHVFSGSAASFPQLLVMPKWGKMIVGLLLLPLCVGGVKALLRVLAQTGEAEMFWVAAAGGAACWWVVYLMLPKPMWVYVAGHEFTHALWTWLFGGSVKKIKVTAQGGHVITTRTNFLIVLAPYFFPIYVALIIAAFLAGGMIWNWTPYRVWFHFLIGAAYAFHLTLTWHILQTHQTDITSQGWLFSGVIIFLGNLAVLLVGVPLLADRPGLLAALGWWLQSSADAITWIVQAGRRMF